MRLEESAPDRAAVWSTGTAPGVDAASPSRPSLPVRWTPSGEEEAQGNLRGGDGDVSAAGEGPGQQMVPDEPEPDAVARGWVVPPGGSRVDAIFVLAGTSLGIGRVERATSPVWLNLDDLVNLDAIGEPVDGLNEVEILMEDQRVIGAGWPDDFCAAVVDLLRSSAGRANATPGSPADTATHAAPDTSGTAVGAPPAPQVVIEEVDQLDATSTEPTVAASATTEFEAPAPNGSAPAPNAPAPAPPTMAPAPMTAPAAGSAPAASLELEDVVYLGGYPGQSKRRKKCVVGMSRAAVELQGPGDLRFRVGWDVVRTIEVQNADEARFRMNTKIHRDASALVIECDQGVTILLEARDCPTIALRSAIAQLLDGLPVVVV